MYICMYVCMYEYMYVCMYIYICMYVCMYICTCVCMYVDVCMQHSRKSVAYQFVLIRKKKIFFCRFQYRGLQLDLSSLLQ